MQSGEGKQEGIVLARQTEAAKDGRHALRGDVCCELDVVTRPTWPYSRHRRASPQPRPTCSLAAGAELLLSRLGFSRTWPACAAWHAVHDAHAQHTLGHRAQSGCDAMRDALARARARVLCPFELQHAACDAPTPLLSAWNPSNGGSMFHAHTIAAAAACRRPLTFVWSFSSTHCATGRPSSSSPCGSGPRSTLPSLSSSLAPPCSAARRSASRFAARSAGVRPSSDSSSSSSLAAAGRFCGPAAGRMGPRAAGALRAAAAVGESQAMPCSGALLLLDASGAARGAAPGRGLAALPKDMGIMARSASSSMAGGRERAWW